MTPESTPATLAYRLGTRLSPRQRAMLSAMGVSPWWPLPGPAGTPRALPAAQAGPANPIAPPDAPTGAPARTRSSQPPQVGPQNAIFSGATAAYPESASGQDPRASAGPDSASMPTPRDLAGTLRPGGPPREQAPLPPDIDQRDAAAWRAGVMQCRACALALGPHAPVLDAWPDPTLTHAPWMVLGDPPDPEQAQAGQAFVGEVGVLLDQMLHAVGVRRLAPALPGTAAWPESATPAYLSLALKCHPAVPTPADAAAQQACSQWLRREVALIRPRIILALGLVAARTLLAADDPAITALPLGRLRGRVWRHQGIPVVVSYSPGYLLRNPLAKAGAWEDLCLAQHVLASADSMA